MGDENTGFWGFELHTLLCCKCVVIFKGRCVCVTRFWRVYMVKSVALLVGDGLPSAKCLWKKQDCWNSIDWSRIWCPPDWSFKNLPSLLGQLTPRPDVVFNNLHGRGGRWNHSRCSWDARHSLIPIPVFWRLRLVWISRYVVFWLSLSMFLLPKGALLLFPRFWPVKFCLLLMLWSLFRKVPVWG